MPVFSRDRSVSGVPPRSITSTQYGFPQSRRVDQMQVHVVVCETADDEAAGNAPHHAPISVRTV